MKPIDIYVEIAPCSNCGAKIKNKFVKAYYYVNGNRFYFSCSVPSAYRSCMDDKTLCMNDVLQRFLQLKRNGFTNKLIRLF